MLKGLLLGLANNIGCLTVCSPILLPFLLSEKTKPVMPILKFMAGRLIAYLFFSATFGYIGLYFEGRINPKIFSFFLIILSIWLIGYSLSKTNLNIPLCSWLSKYFSGQNFPLFAGIVMGLNICPPFLIGLSQTLVLGSVFKSVIFFIGFYIGSSAWLVLFLLAGPLSSKKAIRITGQALTLSVGLWYLYKGIIILIE
ncbi:MAG: sulfite exporter TauE/SafE family protein [Endomicrobiales bacterium]|nr:sulfite exporter TauE/SafE family protein [Endomicrobiales bacterium]